MNMELEATFLKSKKKIGLFSHGKWKQMCALKSSQPNVGLNLGYLEWQNTNIMTSERGSMSDNEMYKLWY